MATLREWYRKAEAAGFRDLETRNADGLLRTDVRTDEASVLVREGPARAEYYRLARQFLHEHGFILKEDRNIWALHAEGASVWDAARQLKLPHTRVQRAVERLAEIMLTPPPRCGRPPANEQQHGRQQWSQCWRSSPSWRATSRDPRRHRRRAAAGLRLRPVVVRLEALVMEATS